MKASRMNSRTGIPGGPEISLIWILKFRILSYFKIRSKGSVKDISKMIIIILGFEKIGQVVEI